MWATKLAVANALEGWPKTMPITTGGKRCRQGLMKARLMTTKQPILYVKARSGRRVTAPET